MSLVRKEFEPDKWPTPKGEAAQDFALRRKLGHWETKDLMQSPVPRAKDLGYSGLWVAESPKPSALVQKEGIGVIHPRSFASLAHRQAYALRTELGQRAYDQLLGRKAKSPKAAAKPSSKSLRTDVTELRPNGVVLLGSDLARALGIKAIGNVE